MARSAEEHRHKRQIRPILCGQGWVTCKHGVDVRWVKDWNMALPSHSAFAAFSNASFCHCSGYFLLQPKWTKSKARYNEVGITCCRLEQVSHTRIEAKESLSEAVGLDHLLTIFFCLRASAPTITWQTFGSRKRRSTLAAMAAWHSLTSLVPFGRSQSAEEHTIAPLGGHQFRGWGLAQGFFGWLVSETEDHDVANSHIHAYFIIFQYEIWKATWEKGSPWRVLEGLSPTIWPGVVWLHGASRMGPGGIGRSEGLWMLRCFAAGAADGHIISLRLKTIETHYFLCWSYFGWSVSVMGMLLNG